MNALKGGRLGLVGACGVVAVVIMAIAFREGGGPVSAEAAAPAERSDEPRRSESATKVGPLEAQAVDLSPHEFPKYNVKPVAERTFEVQRATLGTIDFDQEMSVPVFSPNQGKILQLFAKAGDPVRKGQTLFTIDSPDLLQAESTLLAAAGTLRLTTKALERTTQLFAIQGAPQKDVDQATSDQQAAEGAFKAARDAVRIFGKSDAEIDHILADRRIDSVLRVPSPIAGHVTIRAAAPGQLAQPGNAPAPYTVSDTSTKWLIANVAEDDAAFVRKGNLVDATVNAFPDRLFRARVVNVGAIVDPATHRVAVRTQVADPADELKPGMFASFVIRTGKVMRSPAVPDGGIVREGDGTMTAWVNPSDRRLVKREVKIGIQQDGYTQVLEGLAPGERVVTENALFLNNALTSVSR